MTDTAPSAETPTGAPEAAPATGDPSFVDPGMTPAEVSAETNAAGEAQAAAAEATNKAAVAHGDLQNALTGVAQWLDAAKEAAGRLSGLL